MKRIRERMGRLTSKDWYDLGALAFGLGAAVIGFLFGILAVIG